MTNREARQLINLDQFDSVEEAIEQQVFPIKSFLLTAPILKKTFLSKLKKLQLIVEALETITLLPIEEYDQINPTFIPQKDILASFIAYEKAISKNYLAISATNKPQELYILCDQLSQIHAKYVAIWNECHLTVPDGMLLSKPLDRMVFYSELKDLHAKNIRTIEEVIKNESELSNDFKIEVERIRQSMS